MIRAVVSGGASPIGAAICRALARDGHHVIVHASTDPARAASVADAIRAEGGSAEAVAFDLTDAAATATALAALVEGGTIQTVIHNAGAHDDVPMAAMTPAQWDRVLDVSLNGFYRLVQPLLLPMMATRRGRIVALSSVSAIMGNRGQVNYAAAKAGLIGAVRALSLECAPRGVTVNAVAPGIIESPATAAVLTKEQVRALVPARRAGTPEEVAELVAFLCSDRAAYVTGQTISINGGMA
ncbi:3-oxoacyl-ACP reductase FabG [Roseomonas sp. CCTCC AB2023176]|uniref:3-oxoacyl-ACP reductase FabG n=1 Tax=Roseomonas sp. CCTCC AB2023176 TaxID=3342640 RepID=UPI0035E21E86